MPTHTLAGLPRSLLLSPVAGKGGCPELPHQAAGQNLCAWLARPLFCPQDLASKLREAEETQNSLQAECDQYRTILAETVGCERQGLWQGSWLGVPHGAARKELSEPPGSGQASGPGGKSPGFRLWLCAPLGEPLPLPGPQRG